MRPPRTLSVAVALLLLAGGASATDGFAIDHAADGLVVDAAGGQRVSGTTPLADGSVVSVRIRALGDTHPFLMTKPTTVDDDGRFAVTFDLSELAPLRGGPVEVSIHHDGSPVHAVNATLVTYNMPPNSSLTPETRTPTASTTTAGSTTTTPGESLSGFEVPGLGVAAAVVALLAVAVVGRR